MNIYFNQHFFISYHIAYWDMFLELLKDKAMCIKY